MLRVKVQTDLWGKNIKTMTTVYLLQEEDEEEEA